MQNKKISVTLASIILTVLPVTTLAACPIALANVTSANAAEWFRCIIERILNFIVWPVFIGVSIIMFIWAGILFVSAQGDPGKIGEARKAFIWAVIGISIGLLGYVAVGALRGILGL